MLYKNIGPAISQLRKRAGKSQEKIARQMTKRIGSKINQSYISKVENGHTQVSLKRLELFCLLIRCKPSDVIKIAESNVF